MTCSAILINYNHSAYLAQALDAALNQTVPFDEIIIVDDASTDNSMDIINQRICGLSNVKLLVNKINVGVITAGNIGIQAATSDFIYFLAADDDYDLHLMEWYHAALNQYPDAAMISGNARVCNYDTGKERVFTLPFPQKTALYSRQDLESVAKKRAITFFGGANFIRRDVIISTKGYLTSLQWHADWFLYLLIACRYPFVVIPHELTSIRQSKTQYSHACYDWKQQKLVIKTFIYMLKVDYPGEYAFFRAGGLLPTYDVETLYLLLTDKSLRHYLTPLLAWRLITYKPLRILGKYLSNDRRADIRRWLRV